MFAVVFDPAEKDLYIVPSCWIIHKDNVSIKMLLYLIKYIIY